MRVFNVRLAAILLIVVVFFGVGVYFLQGFQVKRNADFFLTEARKAQERAAEAVKSKDSNAEQQANADALKYLGWYVQLKPNDVDALEELGIALADRCCQGNVVLDWRTYRSASEKLDRALRLDPDRTKARRKLAKMSMLPQVRRYQDAKQHLRLLTELPKDPELLEELGECQAETGESRLAQETFKKAIAIRPSQLTAYVQLANLLRFHFQKPEEGDAWMEKLVRVNPKSYKAHFLRGLYLSDPRVNQVDEAAIEASESLKLAPDDADVLFLMARCDIVKKQYDKARDCAVRGIKLYPANATMYIVLSEIESHDGKRDKAIAVYEQGIKATNRDPSLLLHMANLLIDVKRLDEAKKIVEELRTTTVRRQFIDFLNARIEFVQGHWLAARDRLEGVRGLMVSQPDYAKQIDLWLSQCYGQLGDPDRQEQALRRALAIDPSFALARTALTNLLGQKGLIEPGDDLGQLAPVQRARILLFKTLRQTPSERDWQSVEKALAEAEKAVPDSPEIPLLQANMLVARDRAADAERSLLQAREKDPKQPAVWAMLVQLAERQEDWKKAEDLLEESQKSLGDTVEQRLIQAQHFVRCRKKDTAERLRKLAENADQFPETARVNLWGGLITAALQVGDTEQASSLSRKVAEKQPNNVQVRYLLLDRAIASGDQAAIKKALDDIKLVAGEGLYWLYGQAIRLYLQSNDSKDPTPMLKEALDYLAKARELRKDWSRISLAEARIYDRLGRTDVALRSYREAIDLGERNANVIQRTIQILYQMRQVGEADRLLRRLEGENVSLPPLLLHALAESALQMGESDRAVATARKAVSADSKDRKDYLWLGRVLGAVGLQAKDAGKDREAGALLADAEKAFRRAVEIEPKAPEVWVSLVRFYKSIGEGSKAETAIQNASKNIPAKDAVLTLAQCYDAVNKLDEAQQKYEAALKAAPQDITLTRAVADFYRRAGKLLPAEAQLQRILDGKVPAKESDMVWARRQLAGILIMRRNYKSFKTAQSLLEENLAGSEASPIDRSLLARLKASDPKQGEREKAVAILKNLIETGSATPEDILELAKALVAAGDWMEASGLLRDLVAANGKEPRYLVIYIEALLQHNEVSSAEMYVDRLERLAPNWFATTSLRADLLRETNQPLQALELLKSFVDRADATPRDRATRLRAVAGELDVLGRQLIKPEEAPLASQFAAQAELLYRTYVKENPGHKLVLAVFLGTRDKVDEALDILDGSLQTSNVNDFSQACALIVEGGKGNREQLQRMDKIIQSAIKKFKQSNSLLLPLAELRSRQEQFAQAADIYHEALDKAPDDVMALNNLAVLQALQDVKLDESLKLVDRAIEIAGPLGSMLDSRATVYIAMGNPEKALEDIKAAIVDQETPVRLFHLAQAYSLNGDATNAKMAFKKAQGKGLTKELLQPLEFPAFEKLRQLQR